MIAAAILIAATAAMPAAPLAPAGKWAVDPADSKCTLSRSYGQGDREVDFGIEHRPFSNPVKLTMVVHGVADEDPRGTATLLLSPSGRAIQADYQSAALPGDRQVYGLSIERQDLADIAASAVMTLGTGHVAVALRLQIDQPAMAGLHACEGDLLKSWGVDPDEQDRIATPAELLDPSNMVLGSEDYPADALRAEAQGDSMILWTIGLDGQPSDCCTVGSSGTPSLDAASCAAVMKRARHRPAIGADGKPMVSHLLRTIVWRIPQ